METFILKYGNIWIVNRNLGKCSRFCVVSIKPTKHCKRQFLMSALFKHFCKFVISYTINGRIRGVHTWDHTIIQCPKYGAIHSIGSIIVAPIVYCCTKRVPWGSLFTILCVDAHFLPFFETYLWLCSLLSNGGYYRAPREFSLRTCSHSRVIDG